MKNELKKAISQLKIGVEVSADHGDGQDDLSWTAQEGVLISRASAQAILAEIAAFESVISGIMAVDPEVWETQSGAMRYLCPFCGAWKNGKLTPPLNLADIVHRQNCTWDMARQFVRGGSDDCATDV